MFKYERSYSLPEYGLVRYKYEYSGIVASTLTILSLITELGRLMPGRKNYLLVARQCN